MRLEHALFSEMREQLSSRNIFHEHIKMLGILPNAIKVDLIYGRNTMKG